MVKYFPFIYEKSKKRKKDLPEQLPLYIEEYIPIIEEKSKEKEDQSNIEIIELF